MRTSTFGLGVLGILLVSGAASAAGGGEKAGQSGKGSSESKGGLGVGAAGGGESETGVVAERRNVDQVANRNEERKPWEVSATWETHRVIRQNESAGANKNLNILSGSARYDVTDKDRLRVSAYINQRFIADQGETGFRFDDVGFQYRRTIPLPQQFTLFASAQLTAPTSFYSQKSGIITQPRIGLSAEKQFGEYVTVSARINGGTTIAKYRTAEGGAPNGKYSLGTGADVEVVMPFHKPLSFGAGVGTSYSWFYEPNSTNDPNPQVRSLGTTADTQFSQQPIAQSYYGEIFARYVLPSIVGLKSDLSVAAANGDPSLGSVSVLRDGVAKFNLAYRQTAEVYATLAIRY